MDNYRALIHPMVDHAGRHTYPVWVYDISKPRTEKRNLSIKLAGRYAVVRLIDVFPTLAKAEAALKKEGIALLTPDSTPSPAMSE